jgi:hypothetical protein
VQQECLLDAEVNAYRAAVFADFTKSSYKTHRITYLRFCAYFHYHPVPCSPITIGLYVAFLAHTLKPQSIKNYINIIRIMHLELGYPNPLENNWYNGSIPKGLERLKGVPPMKKQTYHLGYAGAHTSGIGPLCVLPSMFVCSLSDCILHLFQEIYTPCENSDTG